MREDKEVDINPIHLLIRQGMGKPYEYNPFRVIGLRYKRKDKPTLLLDNGKKIDYWWVRAALQDTPETRETLKKVKELREKIEVLSNEVRSLMSTTTKVDVETLHTRILTQGVLK